MNTVKKISFALGMKVILASCATGPKSLEAMPALTGWDGGWRAYKRLDYAKAVSEFLPLVEQGDTRAQIALVVMVVLDEGARKHMDKSQKWFETLFKKNLSESVKWLRDAASQDDIKAWTYLGHLYSSGWGVALNQGEAMNWWLKAAVHGEITAQKSLANTFVWGSKDKESRFWARKAEKRKSPLGHSHPIGKYSSPGDKDVQGYMWLDIAVKQGSRIAKEERDALAERMTPAQISEAKNLAKEWQKDHNR